MSKHKYYFFILFIYLNLAFNYSCSSLVGLIPIHQPPLETKCLSGNCKNGFGKQSITKLHWKEIYYYEGEFKDGYRSGEGALTVAFKEPDKKELIPVIEGKFSNHRKNGKFRLYYKNYNEADFGDKEIFEISGTFIDNQLYPGYLKIKSLKTGEEFEGYWDMFEFCYHGNCINGFSKQIRLEYSGDFLDFPKVDSDYSYEGDYKNGRITGFGKLKTKNILFEGEFLENKKRKGKLTIYNKEEKKIDFIYEGELNHETPHGYGKIKLFEKTFYYDGIIKEGKFIEGKYIENSGIMKNFKGETLIFCKNIYNIITTQEQCDARKLKPEDEF